MEVSTGTPKTGTPSRKAQLEAMSHPDLVQQCLKNIVLLQKLKAKYTEVQSKTADDTIFHESKLEESQKKMKEEEENSIKLKQELTDVQKKYSANKDELECTSMKLETLMSSLKCLQEEQSDLDVKNKSLTSELEKMSDKLAVVGNEKRESDDRVHDGEQQIMALKNHIKSMTEQMNDLRKYEKINMDMKNEISAKNITIDALKQNNTSMGEASNAEVNKLRETVLALKENLIAERNCRNEIEDEFQDKGASLEKSESRMKELYSELDEMKAKKTNLEEKLGCSLDQFEAVHEELALKVEELSSQIEKITQHGESEVSKVQGLLEEEKKQNGSLNEENEKLRISQGEISALVQQLNNEKEELVEKLSKKEEHIESLLMGEEETTKQKNKLEDELSNLQMEREHLTQELSDVRKSREELVTDNQNLVQNTAKLEVDIAAFKKDQVEDVNKKDLERDRFEAELIIVQKEKDELALVIFNLKKSQEELGMENQELIAKIVKLQGDAMMFEKEQMEISKDSNEKEKVLESLKKELEDKDVKIEEQRNECDDFKSKNDIVNIELVNLKGELDKIKGEKDKYVSQMEEIKMNLTRNEGEKASLQTDKENLEMKLEDLSSQIEQMNLVIEQSTQEKTSLEERIKAISTGAKVHQSEKSASESRIDALDEENKKLKDMLDREGEKEASKESQLLEIRKNLEEITALKAELTKSKNAEQILTEDAVALNEKIKSLTEEKEEDFESLKQAKHIRHDLENSKSQCLELEANFESRNAEKQKEIEILEEKIFQLVNDNKKAEVRFDDMEHSRQDVATKLEETKEQLDAVFVEKTRLEGELKVLSSKYDESKAEKELKLSEVQANLEKLGHENDALKAEVQSLQMQFNQAVDMHEGTVRELEEARVHINSVKNQFTPLQDSYDKLKLEHESIVQEKEKMKEDFDETLTQKCQELAVLKSQLAVVNEQCTALSDRIEQSQSNDSDQLTKLTEDFCMLKIENEKSSGIISNLRSEADAASRNYQEQEEKFRSDVEKLEKEAAVLIEARDSYEKKIKQLEDDLLDSQNNLGNKLMEFEKIEENSSSLHNELTDVQSEVENYKTELTSSKSCCQELEVRIELLTKELDTLKVKTETEAVQLAESSQAIVSDEKKDIEESLKKKDDLNMKLRKVALKAKKELDMTKKQLQSSHAELASLTSKLNNVTMQLQGSQTQASNLQMMQKECDKLQDDLDQSREQKIAMQKNLDDVVIQLKDSQAVKDDLDGELSQAKAKQEQLSAEKADILKLLSMTKATVEMLESDRSRNMVELASAKKESETQKEQVSSLQEQLAKEMSSLEGTKRLLSEAKKGMKQSDMLALEMAQYERTVSELQESVERLNKELENKKENNLTLSERLEKLQEDRMAAEQLRLEAEERANQTNKAFLSSKDEIEDLKQETEELRTWLSEARAQIDEIQQESEQYKLQVSHSGTDLRVIHEKMASMESSHSRNTSMLERKISALQTEAELLRRENDSMSSEYENYKVRVHTVLKQQKSKGTEKDANLDQEEMAHLKTTIEQLTTKLQDLQNSARIQENELQVVNADYERLMLQHEQENSRAEERESRWKSRIKDLQLELSTLQRQHTELTLQMSKQNEISSASHQHTIESMQEGHQRVIDDLQRRLTQTENEIFRLQAEKSTVQTDSHKRVLVTSTPQKALPKSSSPVFSPAHSRSSTSETFQHHRTPSSNQQMLDFRSVAREDGEGQENPDQPQTFEQILTSEIKSVVSVISEPNTVTSEARQKDLEKRYEAQFRKLEHLAEVVRENEATVSRLTEQNRVLKEEIRRLEKNQERETSVANMEYLKNVLFKFITLPPCDEKKHLLPVMDTMLKFDQKEKAVLMEAAAGEDAGTQGKGNWSAYFQRWSGLQ